MAQQTLQTMVVISGRVDNSFGRIGSELLAMGSQIDQLSQKVINFGKDSVQTYAGYEQNLLDAQAALSSQYTDPSELRSVMDGLDESAQQWAATTKFHTSDVSQAISEAAHAGWSYEKMLEGIPQAMLLAQAGNLDLSTSLDYIIKSVNANRLTFDGLGGYIDQWATAANSSATNIDELGQAMLRMGSTMQFTDSTAELFTMLGVLANMGTVGSDAGTLLRNSMLRVVAPTDKAKEAFESLGDVSAEESAELEANADKLSAANKLLEQSGFSAYDAQGKLKPFLQIYKELYAATSGMTEEDSNTVLSAIFPTRSITGAMNLLRAASEDYYGLYDKINASGGYAQQVSDIQMSGITGAMAIFDSKVEELKRTFGEALAPQVESVAEWLGTIVDSISGLDDDQLSLLTAGLEGVAAAGPGLILVGSALRLIGWATTPLGLASIAVTGLATGFGLLSAYKDMKFEENFGTMALDLEALKRNVDSLSTEGEDALAPLAQYTEQISKLAAEYETAAGKFAVELSTATLTGNELSKEDQDALLKYGADISNTVLEGIRARRDNDLTMLNQIYPDGMGDADYETYSSLYDLLFGYFDDLEAQASDVGAKLSGAIMDGMEDGVLDEDEREVIQGYVDMLNQIEAEIAKRNDARAYNTALEKAGRISWDSFGEYMDYLAQNNEERVDSMNEYYYGLMGDTRAALDAEREKNGLAGLTDEEWHAADEYKDIEGRRSQAVSGIEGQTGELANTAMGSLMRDAGLYNSYEILKGLISTAQRDAEGNLRPNSFRFSDYLHSPEEAKAFVEDLSVLASQQGFASLIGMGESKFASLVETWKDTPGMAENYNAFQNAGQVQSALYSMLSGNDTNPFGYFATHLFGSTPYYSDAAYARAFGQATAGAGGDLPKQEHDLILTPKVESGGLTGALADMGKQPVEMEFTVTGAAEAASTAYDAAQESLTGRGDLTSNVNVPNGYAEGMQAANDFRLGFGTPTVNARVNTYSGGLSGYATGGRADEPSIFGEAGAEWAIPERHDANTAMLLNEARAASGFTWPELIGASGGSGARTLVYSPTIIANDAAGVEQKLREDKERLERWWREKELRDELEVYS